MKILIKLLILLVILACAGPFFMKGPDGKPLLSVDKIPVLSFLKKIENKTKHLFNGNSNLQTTKPANLQVYKWVDKKGVTHYADKKYSQKGSQLTGIKPISVMPLQQATQLKKSINSGLSVGVSTIPLQQIPKLIDDAKQVKKVMGNRGNQINNAIN